MVRVKHLLHHHLGLWLIPPRDTLQHLKRHNRKHRLAVPRVEKLARLHLELLADYSGRGERALDDCKKPGEGHRDLRL